MAKKKFNYSKLRGRIREILGSEQELAFALNVCRGTLTARWKGESDFTTDEIYRICKLLYIPIEEVSTYFFCEESQENLTKQEERRIV